MKRAISFKIAVAAISLSATLIAPIAALAETKTVKVQVTNKDRVEADVCILGKYNTTARCELHTRPGQTISFVASLSPDGKYDVTVKATFVVLPEDVRTNQVKERVEEITKSMESEYGIHMKHEAPQPGASAVKITRCKTLQGVVTGPVQPGNLSFGLAHDVGGGC